MGKSLVNTEELLRMYKEGIPQKDIAKHFNVTPAAICKKLKRLLPPPKSLESLTEKEKKFVMAIAAGRSRTSAVLEIYDANGRASAKTIAANLMRNPKIRLAIDDLMEMKGIGREYRIEKLRQHLENPDPMISLKSLDMAMKVADDAGERKGNSNTDFVFHTYDLSDFKPAKKENGVNDV